MSVETYLDEARHRVEDERRIVREKGRAYERFVDRVEAIPTETASVASTGGDVATTVRSTIARSGGCGSVREAFASEIRPHSVEDIDDSEPLVQTIEAEFTQEIAMALDPRTPGEFSAQLRSAIVSKARERREEITVMGQALDREIESVATCQETIEACTDWLVEADETPLADLDFERLQERHERLADFREACRTRIQDRQAHLHSTTSYDGSVGITHRQLVGYLYGDLPIEHPVLVTVLRLEVVSADCQRAIRTHLVRRV